MMADEGAAEKRDAVLLREARGIVQELRDDLAAATDELAATQARLAACERERDALEAKLVAAHVNSAGAASGGRQLPLLSPARVPNNGNSITVPALEAFQEVAFRLCGARDAEALAAHLQRMKERFTERMDAAEDQLRIATERLDAMESQRRRAAARRVDVPPFVVAATATASSTTTRRSLFNSPPLLSSPPPSSRNHGGEGLSPSSREYLSPSSASPLDDHHAAMPPPPTERVMSANTSNGTSLLLSPSRPPASASNALAKFSEIQEGLKMTSSLFERKTGGGKAITS